MSIVTSNIKWLMIVSGALTCTMVYGAIAPQAAMQGTFGETLEGPLAGIIVRNWSVQITLIGVMLIYGAFQPPVRSLTLTIATISKLIFVVLVLSHATRYLTQQATIAVTMDALWVMLFTWYLLEEQLRVS